MKQKLAVMAIVTAMVCLSLASVSPSAGAGDVGGSVVQELLSSPVGITINDVAWANDGTVALVVGVDSNNDGRSAAWYYPDNNLWIYITDYSLLGNPIGYTLYACECTSGNMFYVVGEANSGTSTAYYTIKGTDTLNEMNFDSGWPIIDMYDVAIDEFNNALAVGPNDQVYFFWSAAMSWIQLTDLDGTGYDYYDVDWESAYKRFYIVGEPNGGGEAMLTYTDQVPDASTPPTSHWEYLSAQLPFLPEFYSIAWNNDPDLPIVDRYALVGGNGILMGISPYDEGEEFFPGTSYPTGIYDHITWDKTSWDEATVISNMGGVSTLYQFINSSKNLVFLTSLAPDYYTAVDYKPPASPGWGFVVGSAGGYQLSTNAFHSDTTVTLSSDMPHIFSMDMWKQTDGIGGASKFNKEVDVNEIYTFAIEVNYTVGGGNKLFDGTDDVRIVMEAFYDEGSASSFAEPTWATVDNRTRQFQFLWEEGDGGPTPESAAMTYPIGSPGTDEFQLVSWWRDPMAYGGDGFTYKLYFNISFGPQTWAAPGDNTWNAAPTIYDENQAFNDLNSWNLGMMIFDNNFANAANASYDEFGIFQYSNITVAVSPSGNATTGTNDQVLGNPSQITATSNIPYYVNVSVPDLARVGGGLDLAATNVKVRSVSTLATDVNSEIRNMQAFPGPNVNQSVWGNRSQALPADWVVPAPKNGTTAHGPWGSDFNGYATTDLLWYVTIPGATAEGVYQASITFRIGNYS